MTPTQVAPQKMALRSLVHAGHRWPPLATAGMMDGPRWPRFVVQLGQAHRGNDVRGVPTRWPPRPRSSHEISHFGRKPLDFQMLAPGAVPAGRPGLG